VINMATIPTKANLGQARATSQYQAQSYRPIVPDADTGLGEAGRAITNAASNMYEEVINEKMDNDLKQAQADFSSGKLNLLDGDGGELKGYRGLYGQKAIDGFKDHDKQLAELRDKTLESLGGRAKTAFETWSQNEVTRAHSVMYNHLNDQRKIVADQTSLGFIESRQQEIAANPNDPSTVKLNRMEIVRESLAMADRKGIVDENARTSLARSALTTAHEAAIDRFLAGGDVSGARQYVDKYRTDFDQMKLAGIENGISNTSYQIVRMENALRKAQKEKLKDALDAKTSEFFSLDKPEDRTRRIDIYEEVKDNPHLARSEREAMRDMVYGGSVIQDDETGLLQLEIAIRDGEISSASQAMAFQYDGKSAAQWATQETLRTRILPLLESSKDKRSNAALKSGLASLGIPDTLSETDVLMRDRASKVTEIFLYRMSTKEGRNSDPWKIMQEVVADMKAEMKVDSKTRAMIKMLIKNRDEAFSAGNVIDAEAAINQIQSYEKMFDIKAEDIE
jgi:hypothetical protein